MMIKKLFGKKITTNHIYINNIIQKITTIKIINIQKKNLIINNQSLLNKKKGVNKIINKKIQITKIIKLITYSKGKGFCGTIKRHKFASNRASHGNSKAHNKPGSIGMCQTPGRILKGKKMAGKMGNKKITLKNIKIIYHVSNIIIIKGIIAGNKNKKLLIYYE